MQRSERHAGLKVGLTVAIEPCSGGGLNACGASGMKRKR